MLRSLEMTNIKKILSSFVIIYFPLSTSGEVLVDLRQDDVHLKLFTHDNGVYVAQYFGPISSVTSEFFSRAFDVVPDEADVIVQLSSQGGSYFEMKKVANLIRERCAMDSCETYTFVQNRDICYSACVFLYLAGTKRVYAPEAQFGFHAAALTYGEARIWTFKKLTIRRLKEFGMSPKWLIKAESDGIFDADYTIKTARQLRDEGADIFDFEYDSLPFLLP